MGKAVKRSESSTSIDENPTRTDKLWWWKTSRARLKMAFRRSCVMFPKVGGSAGHC